MKTCENKTQFWTLVPIEREGKYKVVKVMSGDHPRPFHIKEENQQAEYTFAHKVEAQLYCDQLNGAEPTRFTHALKSRNGKMTLEEVPKTEQPESWARIICMGFCQFYNLYEFRASDDRHTKDEFTIYFGTLGNEDYKQFKGEV